MFSKSIAMKSINFTIALAFFLLLFSSSIMVAQEIIKENAVDTIKKVDFKKLKIDGVIAKVGDYIILDSDIDKSFLEISSQGGSI